MTKLPGQWQYEGEKEISSSYSLKIDWQQSYPFHDSLETRFDILTSDLSLKI